MNIILTVYFPSAMQFLDRVDAIKRFGVDLLHAEGKSLWFSGLRFTNETYGGISIGY